MIRALSVGPEGFIYAGGRGFNGADKDALIALFNSDGDLEAEIAFDDGFDETVHGVRIDSSGRLVASGQQVSPAGNHFLLFRVENGKAFAVRF